MKYLIIQWNRYLFYRIQHTIKKDNTNAIELSDIAAGIGGFVIIGESVGDYSGCCQ
jgi:hypothetical protein